MGLKWVNITNIGALNQLGFGAVEISGKKVWQSRLQSFFGESCFYTKSTIFAPLITKFLQSCQTLQQE
jgi:hypothetical protein